MQRDLTDAPGRAAVGSRNKAVILGWGQSTYAKRTEHSVMWFLADAAGRALARIGVTKDKVDGLAVSAFRLPPDNVSTVAEHLGLELNWTLQGNQGGASGLITVLRAAQAIEAGDADVILCLAADVFTVQSHMALMDQFNSAMRDYLAPLGFGGTNGLFALVEQRHRYEFGTTREQLGSIAVAQRFNALGNSNALFRTPLRLDEYLSARLISDPLRLFDCVLPCAGADAVVLASESFARRVNRPPVYILAGDEFHNFGAERVVSLQTGLHAIAGKLFHQAGYKPNDLDFLELYDDYPIMVLIQLEDLGFAEKGRGGQFVMENDLTFAGSLPLNTGGGQLSCGQAGASGGMIGVIEAVAQLQGEAEGRQVKPARVGLVSGFGMVGYGRGLCSSAAILAR